MTKYGEKQKKKIIDIRESVVFQLYTNVVKLTPVALQYGGRARGNWQVSVGNPKGKVLENKTPLYQSKDQLPKANGDEGYFIENNLPYINTLEYGGYPSPVKKGTWIKNEKRYEKFSENGFSKQAPHGMVGLTVLNVKDYIENAVKESE